MARKKPSQNLVITKQQARDIALKHQLLCEPPALKGKSGTLKTIEHLGYVQIDTISVIERSHHIVLHTRGPDYTHDHLHALQACDKKIFEYWAHAASYVPMSDYRFYLRKMKDEHIYEGWMERWSKKYPHILRHVRQRIKKEGALSANDFGDIKNRKRGPWWDWKPAKTALEMLFWKGKLMIHERRNFQRVYDLTERVLPEHIDTTMPSHTEEEEFLITRALSAMGVATIKDISRYIQTRRKLQDRLTAMCKAGTVKTVKIENVDKPYFMLSRSIRTIDLKPRVRDDTVHFLSPFDNAIILRDRTRALFDFDYALECYTPPKKRKYGYFCLPVLWKNNLIGRIDPKADRANRVMHIRSIYLEKSELINDKFFISFAACIRSFADFHNCPDVRIGKVVPGEFKREIKKHVTI
ncbi:YcaQ family DNA glycosylase [candidate division WOR-3 bacterium]|nr:YcaQ family DNA glycosylase [candidate division WOR-3 bacterium]